ncbi:MAG: hypothetical protein M0C28_31590 [Candidatus Moduliflexus flocculans]|nr:hypothetical protein [Candidatus Moduliflexus flocculans]
MRWWSIHHGYDWDGDEPLRSRLRHQRHLRAPRGRIHPASRIRASARTSAAPMPGWSRRSPTSRSSASPRWNCMPVQQFDVQDAPPGLEQLLGLQPHGLLRAALRIQLPGATAWGRCDEFRDMVKALHRARASR